MTRIEQNSESWEFGFQNGLDGARHRPSYTTDKLAYSSGYIEGKAVRMAFSQTDGERAVEDLETKLLEKADS